MERYSNIVKGQFFGHVHKDYFYISRSLIDNEPILVTHQIPPLTTFGSLVNSIGDQILHIGYMMWIEILMSYWIILSID
jgi:hypothetical protein